MIQKLLLIFCLILGAGTLSEAGFLYQGPRIQVYIAPNSKVYTTRYRYDYHPKYYSLPPYYWDSRSVLIDPYTGQLYFDHRDYRKTHPWWQPR